MNILVSACLLGLYCRYDGKETVHEGVLQLMEKHTLIPICPEQMGGMETPRLPSEILGNRVINRDGQDVTTYYERGAQQALKLAKRYHCEYAILKERSPSCGKGQIYNGTFSGILTEGSGITAALLEENGIQVIGESNISTII